MRPTSVLALLLLLGPALALCSSAQGQETGLLSALKGDTIPLSLRLRELTAQWRQISVDATPVKERAWEHDFWMTQGAVAPFTDWVIRHKQDEDGERYYTKGQTVSAGSETYLVAYRPAAKSNAHSVLPGSSAQAAPPLELDTPLALCLLNLRTAGSITDIRPFDPAQEVTASEEAVRTGLAEQSNSNLKQIGLALLMYTQDYDETLPPMDSAAVAQKALLPYAKSEVLFVQPGTNLPYQPNTSLSHRSLASFNNPSSMVLYYEASPADGTRGVCFLDGHVKRFPEAAWPDLKRRSHVPGAG